MCCRHTEFIRCEFARPSLCEWNLPIQVLLDLVLLRLGWRTRSKFFKSGIIDDPAISSESFDPSAHFSLHKRPARHDSADADGAFCVEAFEILKVAVEKGVLVVPLDFQRKNAAGSTANMIAS